MGKTTNSMTKSEAKKSCPYRLITIFVGAALRVRHSCIYRGEPVCSPF